MKILQINKFHYIHGGADKIYLETGKCLKENGHEVAFFSMNNKNNQKSDWNNYFIKNIDFNKKSGIFYKILISFKILYNFEAKRKLEKLIKDFNPDVAHLHNIYHQISPSIISTLKKHKIPIVMTLHDYKLFCPNYKFFNKGKICTKCINGAYYNCVLNKCIKKSFVKSFLALLESYLHRKILKSYEKIDLFIAPSKFMYNIAIRGGIPKNKLQVVYNFFENKNNFNTKNYKKDYFFYFGRLSEEKGIDVLFDTFKKSSLKLKIAGNGPLFHFYQDKIIENKISNIQFLGYKNKIELNKLILNAKAVIVPSIWYEVFGLSALEAMSLGSIVIASNIGGLAEIINDKKNGILFTPGNTNELYKILNNFHKLNIDKISKNANITSHKFIKDVYYENLLKIYKKLRKQ